MKDVETIRPDAIAIAAMLPRADVRDRLIGAEVDRCAAAKARWSARAARAAARNCCGAARSAVVLFRGNVDTRLAKLAAGEAMRRCSPRPGSTGSGRDDIGVAIATRRDAARAGAGRGRHRMPRR